MRPSDVPSMISLLRQWHQQTVNVVQLLERRASEVGQQLHAAEAHRQGQ